MAKRRRNKNKSTNNLLATIIFTTTLLIIAAIIAISMFIKSRHVEINKDTLCPENELASITVVLIDRTDILTSIQKASIRNHLRDIKESVPVHGALLIFSVGSTDKELLRPEFKMCNPGRGSEVSSLTGNPKRVEQRWKEGFDAPLERVFDSMLSSGEAQRSPIMESIQSIALTAFTGPNLTSVDKKLIIISDMMQHTDGLSHYQQNINFDSFRKSFYYRKIYTNLEGIECEILYVRRDFCEKFQGRSHIEFWQKYFADQDTKLSRVVSVEG